MFHLFFLLNFILLQAAKQIKEEEKVAAEAKAERLKEEEERNIPSSWAAQQMLMEAHVSSTYILFLQFNFQAAKQIEEEEKAAAEAKAKRLKEEEERKILHAWTAHKSDEGLVSVCCVWGAALHNRQGKCEIPHAWIVRLA